MSTTHSKAAKKFLKNKSYAEWHDNTFWGLRVKRDSMAHQLPEWERLREAASGIKRHTLTNIDRYLEQFAEAAEKNGTIVHWAKDAEEMNQTVLSILDDNGVKKIVKSKSMLTEECEMNPYLEKHGIEVVETDLGERILQLDHQRPSHIVVPATHLSHDDVGHIFERELHTDPKNHDPAYLTYEARLSLRDEFLTAGAGLTGANFGIAETGDIVVCTNEGNADMSTSVPKLQISVIGMEKIIPDYDALSVFVRLLARSATGQPSTVYTSHFRKARPGAAPMHIVIVDNGRSDWLADQEHWETLKCIRCGSCMNTCPVYRWSGGYSYSYFIPGPLGVNLGMLRDPRKYAGNVSACTLCLSCQNTCPVKVNLGEQIYLWRQKLDSLGVANKEKKMICSVMDKVLDNPSLYNKLTGCASVINHLPAFMIENGLNPWAYGHKMMKFPPKPFHSLIKEYQKKENDSKDL